VPDAEIIPLRAALEDTADRGPNALTGFYAAVDDSWESVQEARRDAELAG
jgi:hypothetical protein